MHEQNAIHPPVFPIVHISPENPFNDMYDSNSESIFCHVAEGLNRFPLAYVHMVEINLGNPTEFNKPDPSTFYEGDERGYTDYPFLDSAT
jgi:N-ethylmaleimide reductase